MEIRLYNNSKSANTIKKTLSEALTLTGVLRGECSILNPVIEIDVDVNINNYNYAYVVEFSRYYFISDITVVNNKLWKITLHCDVLMTYASDIRKLNVNVLRNSSSYNLLLEDNQLNTYADERVQCINFPNSLTPVANQFKYYLTLIGGGE